MSGKRVLREAILADRAALTTRARAEADAALVAAACELARGATRIAGYVPLPDEPGGPGLPAALAAILPPLGLLLPALVSDRDLDWAAYEGNLTAGATLPRLWEPEGSRLGVGAISAADIVLVPALAVDMAGTRLGRGGGSYDRALARVRPGVPVIALLYPDELVPVLPSEPHDRPVTAVLTPAGLVPVGSGVS
jgi:5-formyltetrahydrofolate cyclo-ligase